MRIPNINKKYALLKGNATNFTHEIVFKGVAVFHSICEISKMKPLIIREEARSNLINYLQLCYSVAELPVG